MENLLSQVITHLQIHTTKPALVPSTQLSKSIEKFDFSLYSPLDVTVPNEAFCRFTRQYCNNRTKATGKWLCISAALDLSFLSNLSLYNIALSLLLDREMLAPHQMWPHSHHLQLPSLQINGNSYSQSALDPLRQLRIKNANKYQMQSGL